MRVRQIQMHFLKTAPKHFQRIISGVNSSEFRRDLSGYQVGDTLCFQECEADGKYTGESINKTISEITRSEEIGLRPGFVILHFNT